MSTGIRKAGDFCWINILTPAPAEAMEFFARVLGWTYYEIPGVGHGMQVGGRNVGGLFDLDGPNTPRGIPPSIAVMVKVDSADDTCAKVASLGGAVKRRCDIGEKGRMAVCLDPTGCHFEIWEPRAMPGTDADPGLPGGPSWFESMTTDVGKATDFYCALFGWTAEVKPMPGMEYTVFKNGGTETAGMMRIPPHLEGVPPHWGTYFTVDDADEAARVAEGLGARIGVPPTDIPGIGRFCAITSPQGVGFCAIKYLPRQAV
jgi:uncharacterized protein